MGPKKQPTTNQNQSPKQTPNKSMVKKSSNPSSKLASPKKDMKKAIIPKEKVKGRRVRKETFGVYIYKVLKQVHSDIGISKKSMSIMNSFINDIYEKIAIESANLVRYNKKHTLSAREIQCAVKLLLPGELSKHAIIEGAKAVNKIASNV